MNEFVINPTDVNAKLRVFRSFCKDMALFLRLLPVRWYSGVTRQSEMRCLVQPT